jgi:hypothetical protein
MRLVYLSNSKIPSREANSIHVMKMCQAFSHLGHEVTLLAPDVVDGLEPGVSDLYAFYGVDPCFGLRKLPWRPVRGSPSCKAASSWRTTALTSWQMALRRPSLAPQGDRRWVM